MPHRRRLLFLSLLATSLLAAPAARATAVGDDVAVDFPSVVTNNGVFDDTKAEAAVVGDVDGDGTEDTAVAVGAARKVWVSFTPATRPSTTTAGGPGWHGFTITGVDAAAVIGLGDVNGDGRGDIAILHAISGGADVDVVYGRPDGAVVDDTALGTGGFRITDVESPSHGSDIEPWGDRQFAEHQLALVGDQNGDHVPDLAVARSEGAVVVSLATAPGTEVDAADPAQTLMSLDGAPSQSDALDDVTVGDLGDVDGDGRDDIMIAGQTSGGVIEGVEGVAPGSTRVAVRDQVANGHGFIAGVTSGIELQDATTIGDQNGDGRRDVLFSSGLGDEIWAQELLTPAPNDPSGARTHSIAPLDDGLRVDAIGDLDGDGVEDFASDDAIYLSSWLKHGQVAATIGEVDVVGSMRDIGGDGRPDPLVLWADPFDVPEYDPGTATYHAETAVDLDTSYPDDGSGWTPPATTLPPLPPLPPFGGQGTTLKPLNVPKPTVIKPAVKPHGITKTGTRKNDTLIGTAYADVLKGLAGNDTIKGLGGNDKIDGGPGRDHIDAGAGNDHIAARDGAIDTINCGPGTDTVIADRNDKLTGCEHVKRPKAKKKHPR